MCRIKHVMVSMIFFAGLAWSVTATAGNELNGKLLEDPLINLEDIAADTFHPSKMDIGPDGHIYFNSATENRTYRVDEGGSLTLVAEFPDPTSSGFLLGCQFDQWGNLYVVNAKGLWKITAQDLNADNSLPLYPVEPLFWIPDPILPMSVGIGIHGNAYVSDIVGGRIWKIDTGTGEGDLWADNDQYPLLGDPNSTNFLTPLGMGPSGLGLGVAEVMPGPRGKWLYYTNHEGHGIYRIRIKGNGSAGKVQQIDKVFPFALNGAYLDPVKNRIIVTSPFEYFENGLAQNPKAMAAGTLFVLDLNKIHIHHKRDKIHIHGAKIELLVHDYDLGTPLDIVSGRNFGTGNPDKFYVLDGSVDTLMWPTGQIPDPIRDPHAAIRVIQLD